MDPISSPISKLSSGPRAHLRKSGSTILGMLRGSAATACTPTAAVPLSPRFPAAFALAPAAPALPAMTTAPPSSLCQNYYPECEAAINNQIVLELYTSYVYESMASYFSSHEVALKHFARFFLQQSSRGREHAERLMELQTQRGGRLRLCNISRPDRNRWENGLKAMECALHLEMSVNQSLLDLHQLATEKKDAHLCDYLERHYLHEHVKSIKGLWGHITNLRKMGAPESGLADYLFDKLTLGDSDKKN